MVDSILLMKKISKIEYHISRIQKYNDIEYEDFISNEDVKDIILHNLFITIQYMIDMVTHIIADDQLGEMAFVSDCADILHKEKILNEGERENLRKIIGFRNIIAHQYGDVDYKIVYFVMKDGLKDLSRILKKVIDYCGL